jgi:PleD family two-component response regulator
VAQQIGDQIFALQMAHADSSAAPVVTVSLGVCSKPASATGSALALLSQADAQLYAAKADGRHRVKGTDLVFS